jgi:hypothetical protein
MSGASASHRRDGMINDPVELAAALILVLIVAIYERFDR